MILLFNEYYFYLIENKYFTLINGSLLKVCDTGFRNFGKEFESILFVKQNLKFKI